MHFTDTERDYLFRQPLGRLASLNPNGAPQNHPVTYRLNADTGTVDIGGPWLGSTLKFRNVTADPRVSFVVDDMATPEESVGPDGQTGRGLEIRGRAEILLGERPLMDGFTDEVIRIHPRRVVAWNLDGPGTNARDVARERVG